MHRRFAMLACAVAALVWGSTTATAAPQGTSLAGTWSGHYAGVVSGSFTLKWRQAGSTLAGTIHLSNPRGTYSIGGAVHGRSISFGAVGVGATYTGSIAGLSMSGHWKSGSGGGTWSARKAKG